MLVTCLCTMQRSCLLIDEDAAMVQGHGDCSNLGAVYRFQSVLRVLRSSDTARSPFAAA